MKKSLYIVRHAKSSWRNTGVADRDRPLNDRGERDAPMMGRRLRDADARPALIVSSPATRAFTTARLIAAEIGYPREFLQRETDLYLAGVRGILEVILRQEDRVNSLMVVGHNPGLTEFANYLVPGVTSNLPTCGIVAVSIEIENWDLSSGPRVELDFFDFPKRKPGR